MIQIGRSWCSRKRLVVFPRVLTPYSTFTATGRIGEVGFNIESEGAQQALSPQKRLGRATDMCCLVLGLPGVSLTRGTTEGCSDVRREKTHLRFLLGCSTWDSVRERVGGPYSSMRALEGQGSAAQLCNHQPCIGPSNRGPEHNGTPACACSKEVVDCRWPIQLVDRRG